ncbi:sugar phosphate isomerase/epimerase family protein [Paenibacillus baimaensis]|nr:sugar phosphate isomerase/epimerase [Paenibacillus sp. WQ 127069]
MKMAVQLYTLREFLQTPADIETTLRKVKQMGYNAVQVSGLGPIDPGALKEMTDREDLEICATHIHYDDLAEKLDDVIEKHLLWDCKYVGIGAMPQELRYTKEGYLTFAKWASNVGQQLQSAGLKFIYHNHNFEFAKFNGTTGMEILIEETDPSVDFELDVYWVQAGGADPVEWIRKVNGRMKVVHLKDMTVTSDREQRYAEIGEGNMDFVRILDACKEIGVEWGAVEQDQCYGSNPFECLQRSWHKLHQLGMKA